MCRTIWRPPICCWRSSTTARAGYVPSPIWKGRRPSLAPSRSPSSIRWPTITTSCSSSASPRRSCVIRRIAASSTVWSRPPSTAASPRPSAAPCANTCCRRTPGCARRSRTWRRPSMKTAAPWRRSRRPRASGICSRTSLPRPPTMWRPTMCATPPRRTVSPSWPSRPVPSLPASVACWPKRNSAPSIWPTRWSSSPIAKNCWPTSWSPPPSTWPRCWPPWRCKRRSRCIAPIWRISLTNSNSSRRW